MKKNNHFIENQEFANLEFRLKPTGVVQHASYINKSG